MSANAQALWKSRTLPDGSTRELRAGDNPALVPDARVPGITGLQPDLCPVPHNF